MNVVIPAYKPDEKLLRLIDDLHENTDYNIIVVNDGSGTDFDAVFNAIPEYVTILNHEVNRGKGRAMKTGFEYCSENYPDDLGVVFADADGQHLVKDIRACTEAMQENPDTIILGSRKFTGNVPFKSRAGNAITRCVFALASGVKIFDTQTGLRAIPMRYVKEMCELKGERYEYEMNMLLRAAELGIPMKEIWIETVYINDNESSHFNVLRDSFKIYMVIFKFIFSSLLSSLIDYVLFVIASLLTKGLAPNLSRLISIGSARVISSLCNYKLNKDAVFKGCQKDKSTMLRFYLIVVLVFVLNYLFLSLMENVLCWNKYIAQIIAMLLTYPISYWSQRKFVFKTKSKVK